MKFQDVPKGSVVISIDRLLLIVSEDVAARHVGAGLLRLCGTCPAYHLTNAAAAHVILGAALDLREKVDAEVKVDPALAAKLDGYGKASPN